MDTRQAKYQISKSTLKVLLKNCAFYRYFAGIRLRGSTLGKIHMEAWQIADSDSLFRDHRILRENLTADQQAGYYMLGRADRPSSICQIAFSPVSIVVCGGINEVLFRDVELSSLLNLTHDPDRMFEYAQGSRVREFDAMEAEKWLALKRTIMTQILDQETEAAFSMAASIVNSGYKEVRDSESFAVATFPIWKGEAEAPNFMRYTAAAFWTLGGLRCLARLKRMGVFSKKPTIVGKEELR